MKALALLLLFALPPDFNFPRQIQRVAADGHTTAIKIVTWNIDHGSRLDQVARELRNSKAELCLLQEVDSNAARSGLKDVTQDLAGLAWHERRFRHRV